MPHQSSKIDSLLKLLVNAPDTTRFDILLELSRQVRQANLDQSLDFSQKAYQIALEKGLEKRAAIASSEIGMIYVRLGQTQQAINFFNRSIEIHNSIKSQEGIAANYSNLGVAYSNIGHFAEAIEYHSKALNIRRSLKDTFGIATVLNNIGDIYQQRGKLKEAETYFIQAFELFGKNWKKPIIISILNNLGSINIALQEYSKAEKYLKQCLLVAEQLNDLLSQSVCLENLGVLYQQIDKPREALNYFEQSMNISKRIGDRLGYAKVLHQKGLLLVQLGQINKGIQLEKQALDSARSLNDKLLQRDALYSLAQAFAMKGEYSLAYFHMDLYSQIKDSIYSEANLKKILEIEARFDIEAKKKEIELLNKDKQLRNIILYTLLVGFFLIVVLSAVFYNRYRIKSKASMELESMNAVMFVKSTRLEKTLSKLSNQNQILEETNNKLTETLNELQLKNKEIEEKNHTIQDSILYARRFQEAILPSKHLLSTILPEHFILYQPKDIVSGDFYWIEYFLPHVYVAVIDCTGHGVPGAFMSVVGYNLLNQVVQDLNSKDPSKILRLLDERVRYTLKQYDDNLNFLDGMDIALCIINRQKGTLDFAGAHRPLYFCADNGIVEIKGNPYSIGGTEHKKKIFESHRLEVKKGDRIYMFTDGITDQFGGLEKRKYTPLRLKEFILNYQHLPMKEQYNAFVLEFTRWSEGHRQLDDWTLMGVEI